MNPTLKSPVICFREQSFLSGVRRSLSNGIKPQKLMNSALIRLLTRENVGSVRSVEISIEKFLCHWIFS